MFLNRKEYKVSGFEDEHAAPEETLADSLGSHAKIELPISKSVIYVFYVLIGGILFFFLLSAFKLQVLQDEEFKNIAMGNRSAVYESSSVRGMIFDNAGKIIAGSRPIFDLMAVTSDLPRNEDELKKIAEDTAVILKDSAERIFELIKRERTQAVFFIKKDLAKEEVLQIQSRFQKGVYAISGVERWYPDGEKFSGIVGYTGKVSQEDLKDEYYNLNDRKGRAGVEESYEKYLRGEHGKIFFDKAGEKYTVRDAQAGNNLILTIDGKLQKDLYDSLESVLRSTGLKSASAVMQNPNTGEILGLVSFPSFDNSQLVGDLSPDLYRKYFEGKNKPIFNRAIGGKYNPGSAIKPLLALAGLQEKVVNPETTITDLTGYITVPNIYDPDIEYKFRDWKVQGTINLKKALAQSSDIYFYSVGGGHGKIKGLGFEKLEKYFRTFLIDKVLGIDIPGETAGFVPNEEWKLRETGQPWFMGDTYNVSIGQGDLMVTPLWLSSYASAVANGGTFYKPFVVKKITDGNKTIREFISEPLAVLSFDLAVVDVVKDSMREVVVSGTAKLLSSLPVSIAAKTGTAEVGIKGGQLNSVFIAYAPFDNPEIAISIVIENIGKNQGLAMAAAEKFFEKQFSGNKVLEPSQ